MKVYLASMFSAMLETRKRAAELAEIGIECTSSWLKEKSDPNISMKDASLTDSFLLYTAITDVEDINRANAFVLFTVDPDTPTKRGGRHWECGYAAGIGKPIFICGPKENIFHYLPNVTVCADFEKVKECLLKLRLQQTLGERTMGESYALTSSPSAQYGTSLKYIR